jgi:hypothetical protein
MTITITRGMTATRSATPILASIGLLSAQDEYSDGDARRCRAEGRRNGGSG